MSNENKYFAAKDNTTTAASLLHRANFWFNEIKTNGYLDKLREMWGAYHGAYYTSFDQAHRVSFTGEQGELSTIAVNHLRNLAQHMLTMITATRPAMNARSTNDDYKSLVQTKLANGLLDYYLREKRLEKYLKIATEYAIVLGAGFIKMEWNATTGEIYDYIDEQKDSVTGEIINPGFPVYEGDVEFSNLSPFDVVFDDNLENITESIWVLCRSFKNKYDLIAKYPEYEDRILRLKDKSQLFNATFPYYSYNETDLIPVYEFFHKKTEALPNGRYMTFLSDDVILNDGPMPYRNLPIYRIAPSDILGTPYGYTPLFDILPIQDTINSLYSTILTNQSTFGVQNIWIPEGSNITVSQLEGGMNVLQSNGQFGKPEAMNFTQTPQEIFTFLQMLEKAAETISGVNSVTRGNPESSLKSGNALALVQSMSLQFISGLQQSYVQLIEDVGSGLINMLRDFAAVPRIALIAGKDQRTYMREFTGDDLSSINRVKVDVGNPLANSTAGRVQMAEQLLQMGLITTPQQYFLVMETGDLDVMTEDSQSELLLIIAENERLIAEQPVIAMATDQHATHIKEHRTVLSDPALRFDNVLADRVTKHIQEHILLLQQTDPNLLGLIGEKPLAPPGGTSIAPQGAPNIPDQGGAAPQVMNNPQAQSVASGGSLPQIPTPPAPFNTAPVNPKDMLPQ